MKRSAYTHAETGPVEFRTPETMQLRFKADAEKCPWLEDDGWWHVYA